MYAATLPPSASSQRTSSKVSMPERWKVSFAFDHLPTDFPSENLYRKARNAYYKKAYASLQSKFLDKVNDIVREMNAALPQEVKENNKKA